MRKYRVNVNGTAYEVEVEEITAEQAAVAPKTAPVQPAAAAPANASEGQKTISAPMPGNILNVHVKPGDQVKAGDVLMILEAMKMENEIMCPRDGKVVSVAVNTGATVESGAPLCVIE